MRDKKKSLIAALINLVLFSVVPYIAMSYIPSDIMDTVTQAGINPMSFINQLIIMGIFTSVLTYFKGYVEDTSIQALLISIAQKTTTLLFMVLFLGFGDMTNFGVTNFTIEKNNVLSIIQMDMSIFIYLTIITVFFHIIKTFFEWKELRKTEIIPVSSGIEPSQPF